jgi:hypothetical protein
MLQLKVKKLAGGIIMKNVMPDPQSDILLHAIACMHLSIPVEEVLAPTTRQAVNDYLTRLHSAYLGK